MKVLELRTILSRLDPEAEVLVTSASPDEHGSFANSVADVSQNRTYRKPNAARATERPALVLHYRPDVRVWAAKGHGKPASSLCTMRVKVDGGEVGTMMVLSGQQWPEGDRVRTMISWWIQGIIYSWCSLPPDGWEELVFQSEAEAHAFAAHFERLTVVRLVPK